jgi:threonine 3-dehydrogenase
MKAWLKSRPAAGAEQSTVPDPKPAADEVLIRVRRAGICGTDLHIYKWDPWAQNRIKTPLVFGHEMCGEIAELGSEVKGRRVGETVALETHIMCGHCYLCRRNLGHVCEATRIIGVDRAGAYAEYITMPAINAWPVPEGMPLEQAVALEPLGNAVHTVLAGEIAGCSVAVTGCGPIGLFSILVARACGGGPIIATDINEYRLDLARACGADVVVNARQDNWVEAARQMTHGHGLDVVCEMSGQPSVIQQGLDALRNAGRMSLLGICAQDTTLDLDKLVIFKGITVQGIIGRRMFETWHQMTSLIASGRLDISRVITHVMPLADLPQAMELLANGQAAKIAMVPWGEKLPAGGTTAKPERAAAGARG